MKPNIKQLAALIVGAVVLLLTGSTAHLPTAGAAPVAGLVPARAGAGASGISPETLLPGDGVLGPAALNQGMSDIAPGGGGFLVVWEDSRTNHLGLLNDQVCTGGPCGQTLKDIYAARLDANGQLIDTIPIVVSSERWDQTRPRVAWNGQNWLVVWNSERVAGLTSSTEVFAARVSPQGAVLDNPAIVVDANPSVDELWPVVASDGTDWAVVWMDLGSYFELDAARIAPDGTVRDPGGVPLYTPSYPQAPYNASFAFAQGEYLLSWQEWRTNDDDIVGMRITPSLQRIDASPFTISGALGYQTHPSVASSGTDFFVSWTDERSLQVPQPFAARVTNAGQVLDPNGLELNYYFNSFINITDAAWDGTQWVVTWDDSNFSNGGLDVFAARVATNGTVRDYDGFAVAVGTVNQSYPAVAQSATGVRITWTDDTAGGPAPEDIRTVSVSQNRSVGVPATISWGAPSQRQPDIAPNGSGYLSVFVSEVSGQARIRGQRLDANGNAIDQEPFLIASGPSLRNPQVAWNGSLYLVVWEDPTVGSGFVPGTIFGRRVQPDGTLLDPAPVQIMFGNTPDVAALGSTFLVVDTREQVNHIRMPQAVRVNGDGVVQGSVTAIGSSYATVPHVAPLGGRWLATWQHNPTHDNPYATIQANFIDAGGAAAAEFEVAPTTSRRPNLATKADQGLIAYNNGGEIRARRILADGTLLDPGGIQVTSAPMDQFSPALAWDGAQYVIAYEDYRAIPVAWDRPVSDVYMTRVTGSGVVLDPNGVAIANDLAPEIQPAVAALDGSFITGYADFREAAPFGAYRIDVVLGQSGGGGTPTPTAVPTGVVLTGHLTWQGIPGNDPRNNGVTATLELCVGGVAQSFLVTTDVSGFFTRTISLPAGSYNYYLKGARNLSNVGTLALSLPNTAWEFGLMRAGDANDSNVLNATDFSMTRAAFGTSSDPRTDFNRDGTTNALDFTLLRGNFGMAGSSLACP